MDWPHSKDGPDVPHVGWQTGGKRGAGGAQRGHILLDDVPCNRSPIKEKAVMKSHSREVRDAATALGVACSTMNEAEADLLRSRLLHNFLGGLGEWPNWFWEHVSGCYSVRCTDGWRAVGEYSPHGSVELLFDPKDDTTVVSFPSGLDAVRVLSECSGFEVYFTDKASSFLLIYNHHDYLIACATAIQWARERYPPNDGDAWSKEMS